MPPANRTSAPATRDAAAEAGAPISEREALAAVGCVLAVTGSAFDLQPMLDRIAAEATALCRADLGFAFLRACTRSVAADF